MKLEITADDDMWNFTATVRLNRKPFICAKGVAAIWKDEIVVKYDDDKTRWTDRYNRPK